MTTHDDAQLAEVLDRLVSEGTLQPEQARAVREGLAGPAAPEQPAGPGGLALATLAAAYVGVGLLAAAVATLIGQNWDDLTVATRSLTFAAITALLIGVGAAMRGRFDAGRGLAWLVAVLSAGALGAALLSSRSAEDNPGLFLAAGIAALVVAVPLLALRRAAPQVLAFVGALVVATVASVVQLDVGALAAGSVLWAVGAAVAAAAVARVLPVPPFAMALGGLIALAALQVVAVDSLLAMGLLGLALAAGGYALAVRAEPAVPLTLATLTVATTGPRILGHWLHGSIGAAGVLAASGIVVLVAAAVHVRLVRRRH